MSAPPPPSGSSSIPEPSKPKYPDVNANYPPIQPPPVGYPPVPSDYAPQHAYPPPGYPTASPVPYGLPPGTTQYWVPPTPIPGMAVKPPAASPLPGQEVIRYDVIQPEPGCGKCDTLSASGWIAVVCLALILGFIFLPLAFLAFIPCCMESCHEKAQRPVYGYPPRPPV